MNRKKEKRSFSGLLAAVLAVVVLLGFTTALRNLNEGSSDQGREQLETALRRSAVLDAAARVRAEELVEAFSHTRPDGRYFSTVFAEHGITYRYSGENIAWGQKSPEEVVTAWMNSAGHRANILNAKFTELGVGYRQNARGVNYFTQLFIY